MPAFDYTAIDPRGALARGRVEAEDATAAQRAVEALGLVPSAVAAAGGGSWLGERVPPAQTLMFVRALAGLLAAGVPLSRALTVIEREARHPAARAAWTRIHARVRDGAGLADSLGDEPGAFPAVAVAMVRAGETGGFLAQVLEQIADYQERARELRGRIGAALVYPALLSVIASAVVAFLLVWFIPRFAALFASQRSELPLLTQAIQAASTALVQWGWLLLLAVVAIALAARWWLRSVAGARWWARLVLRLPAVSAVVGGFARVRCCRMLGTLLTAGVPLLAALAVARQAAGNPVIADGLDAAGERVRQGEGLAVALDHLPELLPGSALEALAVAEGAGRLPQELLRQADQSERELDRALRTLVALAEPLLLLVMASIVGLIVVGMLLPIFDLWGTIR